MISYEELTSFREEVSPMKPKRRSGYRRRKEAKLEALWAARILAQIHAGPDLSLCAVTRPNAILRLKINIRVAKTVVDFHG